jgi:hypothetical protein
MGTSEGQEARPRPPSAGRRLIRSRSYGKSLTGLPALTIEFNLSSELNDADHFQFQRFKEVSTMIRTCMTRVCFVACALMVAGCDSTNKAAKKVEEGAKSVAAEVKVLAKEAAEEAKVAVIKPVEEALPKIEEKIKGLSGETAAKAKEKFVESKKLLEEFKSAAPGQWQSLKDGLIKSFEELKKLTGLEK